MSSDRSQIQSNPQSHAHASLQLQKTNHLQQRTSFRKRQLVVGVCLVIASSLTIIFGIVAAVFQTLYASTGNPLWTGAIILVSAFLCLASGKPQLSNKGLTECALGMNIISVVFAVSQIMCMSFAVAYEKDKNKNCNYDYVPSDPRDLRFFYRYGYFEDYGEAEEKYCDKEIAIDIVLIFLGVCEFSFATLSVCVLSSILCCSHRQPKTVVYQVGQPMLLQDGVTQAPIYQPLTQLSTAYLQPMMYPVVQAQVANDQPQQYFIDTEVHRQRCPNVQIQQPSCSPTRHPSQYPTQHQKQQEELPNIYPQDITEPSQLRVHPTGQLSSSLPEAEQPTRIYNEIH